MAAIKTYELKVTMLKKIQHIENTSNNIFLTFQLEDKKVKCRENRGDPSKSKA